MSFIQPPCHSDLKISSIPCCKCGQENPVKYHILIRDEAHIKGVCICVCAGPSVVGRKGGTDSGGSQLQGATSVPALLM